MTSFAPLNLRWNPFGEVPPERRGALTVPTLDIEACALRLARPGFAVELLGAEGRGKSSHLLALRDRFPGRPVTYVEIGARPRVPRADVVFVDEAQRLAPLERARLFAREASFVLATHDSLGGELRAAGVEVLTHRVEALGPEQLAAFVERRLEWARLRPGPLPSVPLELLARLSREHGTDLRALGDALYVYFQRERDRARGAL